LSLKFNPTLIQNFPFKIILRPTLSATYLSQYIRGKIQKPETMPLITDKNAKHKSIIHQGNKPYFF